MDQTHIYIERINKVIDYIESNLDKKITLDELSKTACLSKYHFHRIFHSFMNESLYGFINRLRVEHAAVLLLTGKYSVTDAAFSCGFNDSATFSRAFKKHFNISASSWKKENSNIHQDYQSGRLYTCNRNTIMRNSIEVIAIHEKIVEKMTIAYVRNTGAYAGNSKLFHSLYKKLMKWAAPGGYINSPAVKYIVIYHDPAGITEDQRLRISVGITIPARVSVSGEIGKLSIVEGRYIICRFRLKNDEYGKAWTSVYRDIIPQRGLQPCEGYCYEMYPRDCYDKTAKKTIVDICIPVKKLQ